MSQPTHFPVESHLSPITGHTFSREGGWWRAIVHSEDQYGNGYVRLYLWRNSDSKGWIPQHKWNVDPHRWESEKTAVDEYLAAPADGNPPYFPVQHYHVVGGQTIERTDEWWTAIVQFEKERASTHDTRLYMWRLEGDEPNGTGFKWNISNDTWHEEQLVADSLVTKLD